jgi:hypothetical protein
VSACSRNALEGLVRRAHIGTHWPASSCWGNGKMLKEKYQKEIDEILSRYPVKRSALIPLLTWRNRTRPRVRSSDEGDRGALAPHPAPSL